MHTLHIVQGGIANGDKDWLENAADAGLDARHWVVPKSVGINDEVVICIVGLGFFATACVKSEPFPHPHWPNRYGAALTRIKRIEPAISLAAVQRHIPNLTWAKYPRSITTPSPEIAIQVRNLIRQRRASGVSDIDEDDLIEANIEELRAAAILNARPTAPTCERKRRERVRSRAVHLYVIRRANGVCEGCGAAAPFLKPDGTPYLEPHHVKRVADDGPDHPASVIALCPNCHCEAHHSKNAKEFNCKLTKRLAKLEPRT